MASEVDRPEPGPLAQLLGREKRIEDLLDEFRRHAGAGVGDLDADVRPGFASKFQLRPA